MALKYWPVGVRQWKWVPAIANPAAPTAPEITAGTALEAHIETYAGWETSTGQIATPTQASTFTGSIPGRVTVGGGGGGGGGGTTSITIYDYSDDASIRTLLAEGTNGFIVIADQGFATGRKADVFPVRIAAQNDLRAVDENAAHYMVQFTVTSQPSKRVTLA